MTFSKNHFRNLIFMHTGLKDFRMIFQSPIILSPLTKTKYFIPVF